MAPITYQQQALALLTARDPESAIAATNPVTLPRAVKYLEALAEHVMRHPAANPIPPEVIDQLRQFATLHEPAQTYRLAHDLEVYNKIMRHMHKSPDPVGEADKIRALYEGTICPD